MTKPWGVKPWASSKRAAVEWERHDRILKDTFNNSFKFIIIIITLFKMPHIYFFFLLYTLSDSVTAIKSASKHSTMKISRSYVNLRVIQVFFLLILFKALSNVCTYNVFSSIHSSAKREESKMKVLRKFIAIFWPGYQKIYFFFNGYEFHFNSNSLHFQINNLIAICNNRIGWWWWWSSVWWWVLLFAHFSLTLSLFR